MPGSAIRRFTASSCRARSQIPFQQIDLLTERSNLTWPQLQGAQTLTKFYLLTLRLGGTDQELAMRQAFAAAVLSLSLFAAVATAQDMMRHVDLSSPDMIAAEMTRAEVEAAAAAGRPRR